MEANAGKQQVRQADTITNDQDQQEASRNHENQRETMRYSAVEVMVNGAKTRKDSTTGTVQEENHTTGTDQQNSTEKQHLVHANMRKSGKCGKVDTMTADQRQNNEREHNDEWRDMTSNNE